ncbi:MAG TPA: malto-oligosyltrehalose synthase [Candidatus Binataceae bacterium]|nr:malto-oligosyltrehalose synthase [Candidatus Binataceae bacterium]
MRIEPRATYRIQLHPGFDFNAAAAIVPYLAELGISHFYSSPCLQAAPGSTHGYDVVDYHLSHDLGGTAGHERLSAALRDSGMGKILDIVPNHMAITGRENPWWWDVLENGPASRYSAYFDVDWAPPEARLRNAVLLPVLGDHYGRVLEAGEIKLVREGGDFTFRYHERTFPVAARSLDTMLARAAQRCGNDELAFIADSLTALPFATDTDTANLRRRQRDVAVLKAVIGRLIQSSPDVAAAIDETVGEFNADHDLLHAMLERQNYRLAFWRAAGRDLGYRRFFDISNLIGLRMENEQVFNDTHSLVLRWLLEGVLDGVRIDHIDGLRDPHAYLQRLSSAAPKAWIAVEKILQAGERLRESWPVAGTTGYDFLNRVGGLFVDSAGEAALTRLYVEFTGQATDYLTLARNCKEMVARDVLGSELNRLTELFVEVCENDRRHRDYTRHLLHEALVAAVARFAVYRTYCRADSGDPDPEDVRYVDQTIAEAKSDRPDLDPELFDFLHEILLLREPGEFHIELALSFQQFTGPVMAKALEDTAFYRYHRLICLNEVGGDPSRFGVGPDEFHQACLENQRRWSMGLLATSTHDTKRSEDVRARLALLSEMPQQWADATRRWSAFNRVHWSAEPDRNAEYLLYQTLAGAWPITKERVWPYMLKAVREAKLQTSWTKPDEAYEKNVQGFVEAVMGEREFLADLEAFVMTLLPFARMNSLAQTLLKLTAPGIPDFYQGTELWDFSLVDPDNRRPVDYGLRRRLLREVKCAGVDEILKRADEGLTKLWVIQRALAVRSTHPRLFGADAVYEPLSARGSRAACVIAFMRAGGVITVVPRLVFGLAGRWEDTALDIPPGRWRSELGGEVVEGGRTNLARLTARFPVCLLVREEPT